MPCGFRLVAVDYDGTIATDDRANEAALHAIAALRDSGIRVALCTGRIGDELRAVFPDVEQHFDAVIAENGAVVGIGSQEERTYGDLPLELLAALDERGVPFRTGRVLIATDAGHDRVILAEIERLGLEVQLVFNRGALMVLPAGVSKGSGLLRVLAALEVSRHSAIGIGDAENDHSLLAACEVGVAVGNAVPALKSHADICLAEANGAGVAGFLMGPVLQGEVLVHPARWHVDIGRSTDDEPVQLPGSGINLLVAGASCSGKSHFAGLLVERLVALDYAVCVIDAEGDHVGCARLPGVIAVGGTEPLPTPHQLARLVRNRFSSVVVDLSQLRVDQKQEYSRRALVELEALRAVNGYPHWIVLEEADQLLGDAGLPESAHPCPAGYCLVTHRPALLSETVLASLYGVVAFPGAEQYANIPFKPVAGTADDRSQPFELALGEAVLATNQGMTAFRVAERSVAHVRHQHKYTHAQVPASRRFYFGSLGDEGNAAGNMIEFRTGIVKASDDVLRSHLGAGDLSRWTGEVLADDQLSERLRAIERWFCSERDPKIEDGRTALLDAIEVRYGLNGVSRLPPDRRDG
ncbi:MAG: HAD family hydrolase [Gemmatimonadota bacterium]